MTIFSVDAEQALKFKEAQALLSGLERVATLVLRDQEVAGLPVVIHRDTNSPFSWYTVTVEHSGIPDIRMGAGEAREYVTKCLVEGYGGELLNPILGAQSARAERVSDILQALAAEEATGVIKAWYPGKLTDFVVTQFGGPTPYYRVEEFGCATKDLGALDIHAVLVAHLVNGGELELQDV